MFQLTELPVVDHTMPGYTRLFLLRDGQPIWREGKDWYALTFNGDCYAKERIPAEAINVNLSKTTRPLSRVSVAIRSPLMQLLTDTNKAQLKDG